MISIHKNIDHRAIGWDENFVQLTTPTLDSGKLVAILIRCVLKEMLDIDSDASMSPIAPFYAKYLIFFYTSYAAMNPNTRSLISPVYSKHRPLTPWRE